MSLLRWAVLVLVCVVAGCRQEGHTVEPVQVTPEQNVRSTLADIAASGEVGSGMVTLQQGLEQMKATQPELAQALLQDAQQLSGMTGPEEVKAKAKEMLDKLGASEGQ